MVIALLVTLSVVVVFAAGEAVRSQCRRMLTQPVDPANRSVSLSGDAGAVLLAGEASAA